MELISQQYRWMKMVRNYSKGKFVGDIAQMARALRLHRRGREFESHYLHKKFNNFLT